MLEVTERLIGLSLPHATLTLPFELRQRSRQLVRLDDGRDAGLFLPRGTVLRQGDLLRAQDGTIIQIRAAMESVSTATADNVLTLARVCYHLGNRHVPLQIGSSWVRYLRDHVLDQMVYDMGLNPDHEDAPFEPEAGAYAGLAH